ncbi:MAG: hypothetical protein ACIAZJ_20735 [Gimesia chilikensis]|uniref:hypothetical protein n=1 Tax=Gimesia chilikensis TaxID=2605989 RepID=UPI00379D466C
MLRSRKNNKAITGSQLLKLIFMSSHIAPDSFPLPADGIQTNQKFYENELHPRT